MITYGIKINDDARWWADPEVLGCEITYPADLAEFTAGDMLVIRGTVTDNETTIEVFGDGESLGFAVAIGGVWELAEIELAEDAALELTAIASKPYATDGEAAAVTISVVAAE